MDNLELRFMYTIWNDDYQFALIDKSFDKMYVAEPFVMREVLKGGAIGQPTFSLQRSAIQALFNKLWDDGFRPTDGTGNSGHVEALKYHLEDMRKLVFEKKP